MARVVVAVCALLLQGGCSGNAPVDDASTSAPVLAATLTQSRVNEGTRLINAELTNTSDSPVTVETVTLDSSQFGALTPEPKGSVFAPGATIDLAIDYGEPDCDGALEQASYTVTLGDGSTQELSIDADGMAWLGRLYDRECALASIADVATIEYGERFRRARVDGELVLAGDLLVHRPPGSDRSATLTIRGLAGSVLIRFEPDPVGSLPVDLPADQERLEVPITFSPFRCDQHARGQSSQTFLLSVYVVLPGEPQQRLILVPDRGLEGQILDLIADVCGDATF